MLSMVKEQVTDDGQSHLSPPNPYLQVQRPLVLHCKDVEPSGLQLHSETERYEIDFLSKLNNTVYVVIEKS